MNTRYVCVDESQLKCRKEYIVHIHPEVASKLPVDYFIFNWMNKYFLENKYFSAKDDYIISLISVIGVNSMA